eukprot:Tamp_02427.p1 GENE.Tamp_02427~~Tamp_02427.p1  ORF type:complete len:779 (+),score=245.92 Tamp_02427:423-2759(+)
MGTRYRVPTSGAAPPSSYLSKPTPPAPQEPPNIIEQQKRDSSGRTTVKRYQKGQLLGKGGFAKCYKVTDLDTRQEWACKIIQKCSLTKQRHKQKLQSEIKIHRSIHQKHVVRFEDVFEDKENVYIVMELCPNQTMLELVKRKKRLTESDTRRYMLQTLDAVRHMHQRNVIHRDLKLGNFFLGKSNEIKIGDFGLACKLAFDGERKKTLCGTPNYIAPEVLDGKNGHSFEVDVWSIGVVLYTCLVGKPPFETSDIKSTYKLIRANSYSFPDRLEISEGAKRLVRRILQSRPEARPTIEEILQDEWFLGQGLALLQGRDEVAQVNNSGNSGGNRTKLMEARIYSTTEAEAKKAEAQERQPLHPVQDSNIIDAAPAHAKDNKRKTDPPSSSRPDSAVSATSSHTTAAPSVLERNVSTATTSSSGMPGGGNIYRPFSNAHSTTHTSASSKASAPVAPQRDREQSPMKKVIKQLGSLDVKGAAGSTPPKSTVPRASGRPGSTLGTFGDAAGGPHRTASATGGATSDAASVASTASAPSSARGSANGGEADAHKKCVEDEEALKLMHQNVAAALADASGSSGQLDAFGGSLPLPNVWVSRWVDYSKKYGLGYKLSNGQYGVFFNDATKILLKPDGDKLEYIQRQRDEAGAKYDTRSDAKMSEHTKDLAKKVTLMQHFRNYLDDPNRHPSSADTADGKSAGDEGVYVRKWMRTRHSVIFRLSNNCLQVSFLDDTEVLLWANRRWVTIKSKDQPRRTLDLKDAASITDAAKRLKYVHDILAQLVST